MATFPSITPKYGQQKRSQPITTTVRFADGYEHRIKFGLAEHQNPKVFNFTFLTELNSASMTVFPVTKIESSEIFSNNNPDLNWIPLEGMLQMFGEITDQGIDAKFSEDMNLNNADYAKFMEGFHILLSFFGAKVGCSVILTGPNIHSNCIII